MTKEKDPEKKPEVRFIPLIITIAAGIIIWFIPVPAGLHPKAWHLFAIFVATIIGFISKPLPMGSIAIFALAVTALTGTLSIEETLSGFGNKTIWLIVIAFFISRGFIKTGLGARIAYMFVRVFGKKTLGLSYSLLFSDLILAPAIPSNTARAGGIIFPIIHSLSETFGSTPDNGTERKIGAFLLKVGFQGNLITSAMFLTAMAANPLIAKLAHDVAGVNMTWTSWALASIVPGLVSLIVTPLVIYKLYPPEIKETPDAAGIATNKLKEMGPFKRAELFMVIVFFLVLFLWILGSRANIDATTTALIGLSVLFLTQVLTWDDIKKEQGAWDTLIWFATLLMLASFLNTLGMVGWFSDMMKSFVSGFPWMTAFLVLILVYFYSHYFFASATAHISAMYSAFFAVTVAAGAPPLLSAFALAFFSNLFGCTTHYGAGAAPVFFGAGYIPEGKWWFIGFILSIVHLVVWLVVGGLWWKVLGMW
ncbi:anion permease [Bacillus glycinifermentans]|uniref:2-oxoglutarate translocator n=1 Tax=Bacillus glycinifermentans TaxID=1664069 RepID=A0A0T6BPJ3_9BACI|nr:anion permease [Bacillus glycinifermentans]ATH94690.1 anion permease [Bacillus glycinifermentans]KRT93570.1 2-oxoglutarate translocator [Bacillus glycinifermentans]MEC0486016.1 anion permease [Bacillus glycinifermentans]